MELIGAKQGKIRCANLLSLEHQMDCESLRKQLNSVLTKQRQEFLLVQIMLKRFSRVHMISNHHYIPDVFLKVFLITTKSSLFDACIKNLSRRVLNSDKIGSHHHKPLSLPIILSQTKLRLLYYYYYFLATKQNTSIYPAR